MSEEAVETPVAPAAPVTSTSDVAPVTPTPAVETPVVDVNAFKVPDEFKEKGWASKVKSQEDLFKQLNGMEELIGKKSLIPDLAKATDEEKEAFFAKTRPADISEYKFAEGTDQTLIDGISPLLQKFGVHPAQANPVLEEFNNLLVQQAEAATSAEGFKATMQEKFGDKYEEVVANGTRLHKQFLSPESLKTMEAADNKMVAIAFELANNMAKAYGATEGIDKAGGNAAQPASLSELDSQYQALFKKVRELDSRPHKYEDKQVLTSQMENIQKQRIALQNRK